MKMEKQPFEDVSPFKEGDFPGRHAHFPGGATSIMRHVIRQWVKMKRTEVSPISPNQSKSLNLQGFLLG